MKDSGIEWIGDIPKNWILKRFKHHFSFGNGLLITKDNLVDTGVAVISYGQIHAKYNNGVHIHDALIRHVNENYLLNSPESLVTKGDFIFADTSEDLEGCGNFIYIDQQLQLFAGYHTIIAKSQEMCDNRFLAYLFLTDSWRSQIRSQVTGIKVYSISKKILSNITIIQPSSTEQQKISNYLDEKCSKIDEIIEKQQAIIEKLKEYKSSVITEAVTKGLNPNAEMKDSGVEWLGKYPAHWNYYAFKNVLFERNEKNVPIKTDERLSLSIDKGVTLYSEKTTNLDRYKDDVSQYKIAHAGDLIMNSMNMIVGAVGVSDYFGCVSPAYYTYYDTEQDHITARYCDYLIRCKTMRKVLHSLGKGILSIDRGDDRINTCRLKVSRNDLRQLKIPVPPISEQREIVTYLEEKEKFIDKTIKDREIVIAKLQEYKKSLIYEVVTGKKVVEA